MSCRPRPWRTCGARRTRRRSHPRRNPRAGRWPFLNRFRRQMFTLRRRRALRSRADGLASSALANGCLRANKASARRTAAPLYLCLIRVVQWRTPDPRNPGLA
jgi:hypothetical protein